MSRGRYIYRPMNTPLFPAWRHRLAALGRRAKNSRSAAEIENEFSRFLPGTLLKRGQGCRDRIFTRKRTFWCFLWQVLHPNTACRAVVRKMQAECETQQTLIDENTSAYCQARSRLPLSLMEEGLQKSAECADRMVSGEIAGWGRPIKVVDATSFTTPDTPENRKKYHYPTGQKKGCGFPVMRALAVMSLASGAICHIVTAACYTAELVMLKPLWPLLRRGDILLGDRMYGCFPLLAALPLQGVDVVARLNQCRQTDLRKAKRLGNDDWLTSFIKAYIVPPYMTKKEWKQLPENIPVRIIRSTMKAKGFRTHTIWIVTTLIDPVLYPAADIIELFLRRWEMEISFRDLKTTLGMEKLNCRSPHMIEKELRMFLIAHNCLRALMAQAASSSNTPCRRISFKGTMDTIRSFHPAMLRASSKRALNRLHKRLLEVLADDCLPLRPDRKEPRAVKKRPKPYPRLTKPRHQFKEVPHRSKPIASIRPQTILT